MEVKDKITSGEDKVFFQPFEGYTVPKKKAKKEMNEHFIVPWELEGDDDLEELKNKEEKPKLNFF